MLPFDDVIMSLFIGFNNSVQLRHLLETKPQNNTNLLFAEDMQVENIVTKNWN